MSNVYCGRLGGIEHIRFTQEALDFAAKKLRDEALVAGYDKTSTGAWAMKEVIESLHPEREARLPSHERQIKL